MVRLHRQVCAFIDVLGGAKLFRDKDRRRASDFFRCLGEFERRLNGWSHHFPRKRRTDALVKTFSDNIVVAFPFRSSTKISDEDVVHVFLTELAHQIYELTLLAGFPMRGAVSVGALMFTDKFLFGPALVEAVQFEKAAVFPRVLLCESVLRYVKPEGLGAHLVVRDADGVAFLDHLGGLFPQLELPRDYVEKGLLDNATRIHERQKLDCQTPPSPDPTKPVASTASETFLTFTAMLNHVMLGSNDIERSKRFYDACLGRPGRGRARPELGGFWP